MAAPATAPPTAVTNGHGPAALAEAAEGLDRARARVADLQRILRDPGAGRLARLEAERDLPEARIAEATAEIRVLELAEEAKAARDRHRAEQDRLYGPAVKQAGAALHTALERVRDTEFAALIRALDAYMQATGNAFPGADALAWPGIFARPEGSGEDQVAFRARWLRENGYLT